MKKRNVHVFVNTLFLLISSISFILCPDEYSYKYVVFTMMLFVLQMLFFIPEHKEDKYLNFHVIFLATLFVAVFLYPVFIYPFYGTFLSNVVDTEINKGTSLVQTAISAYMLGADSYCNRNINKRSCIATSIRTKCPNLLMNLYFLVILLSIIHYSGFIGGVYASVEKNGPLITLSELFYTIVLLWNTNYEKRQPSSFFAYLKVNRVAIIPMSIYLVILLAVGIRSVALSLMLMTLTVYILSNNNYSPQRIFLFFVSIAFLFFGIMLTRNGGELEYSSGDVPFVFNLLSDLICVAKPIYAGLDYVEHVGFLYGSSIWPQFFSPFPLVPSYITELFYGTSSMEQTTQYIISDYIGTTNLETVYFVGTNCVIDIYMNMGAIVTLFVFFVFGRFVEVVIEQRNRSIYMQLIYVFLMSESVFVVRGTLYSPFRLMVWGCVVLNILLKSRGGSYVLQS